MRQAFIYGLTDPATREIRYVGKSFNPPARLAAHMIQAKGGKSPVHCWIRSLPARPVVEILEVTNAKSVSAAEVRWISELREGGFRLMNLADGGEGTPGHRQSPETIAKRVAKTKGLKRSQETIERMRAAAKGRGIPAEARAAMNSARWTPEARALQSARFAGKPLSAEHKAKLSAAKRSMKELST